MWYKIVYYTRDITSGDLAEVISQICYEEPSNLQVTLHITLIKTQIKDLNVTTRGVASFSFEETGLRDRR